MQSDSFFMANQYRLIFVIIPIVKGNLYYCSMFSKAEASSLRHEFWTTFGRYLRPQLSADGEKVNWIKRARWTVDDKYYTSSGVSAGMDMTLGFLSDIHGIEFARKIAFEIEYNWTEQKDNDNFSNQ